MKKHRRLRAETMWAVAMPDHRDEKRLILYTGTWLTRRDAIKAHTETGDWSWERCRSNGDLAVRVTVSGNRTKPQAAISTSGE